MESIKKILIRFYSFIIDVCSNGHHTEINNKDIQSFELVFKGKKLILIAHFSEIKHHLLMVMETADLKEKTIFSFRGLYLIGDLTGDIHEKIKAEGILNAQSYGEEFNAKIQGTLKAKSNKLYCISINVDDILRDVKDTIIGRERTDIYPLHKRRFIHL